MAQTKKNEGWQLGLSLTESNRHMFDNQVSCDVQIRFSDTGHQIGAHRYMLICRSPVFEAILGGDFNVQHQPTTTLNIDGVEFEAFREVLKYIYYDGANVSGSNVISILHTAERYQLNGLLIKCLTYIERNMSVGNICTLLNSSRNGELLQLCQQFARNHASTLLQSNHFLRLSEDALYRLVSGDLAYDHVTVCQACLRWANHQSESERSMTLPRKRTPREILGQTIYSLGFTSLSSSQLVSLVRDTQLLSEAEQLALFRYVAIPDEEATSLIQTLGFSIEKALLTTPIFYKAVVKEVVPESGEVESGLVFSPNVAVLLKGIGLFGTTKCMRYAADVQLVRDSCHDKLAITDAGDNSNRDEPKGQLLDNCYNGFLQYNFSTKLWSRGSRDPIRVIFPTAVVLDAAVRYRLKVKLNGINSSSCYLFLGTDQMERVHSDSCTFQLAYDQSAKTGLIAQLIFALQ